MRATNSKKLDCHTTYLNKHLGFVRFSDFLVLWGFFRGNQSNKQEEARLPDNVFEQTPRICFEVWGFGIFLGLFRFFKCNQGNKQEEARLPDNVFEQTPRILFWGFGDFLGLLGFFKGNQGNKQE